MTSRNGHHRRFCVEVGGTFTDWVVLEDNVVTKRGKVLSTREPAEAVITSAIEALGSLETATSIMHGSTVATNTVLERNGAPTALVTTRGFRDVLEIQRQTKSRLFDLFYRHPQPLVSRDNILEVPERIGPLGEVWEELDLDELEGQLKQLLDRGIESVAVSLLHSYVNGDHELETARYVEERFPGLHVTRSSEVLPKFREFERTSTTVISAYLKPRVDGYVRRLEEAFQASGFRGQLSIMQANGGTVPAEHVRRHAASMVLSGPAAGVGGAVKTARGSGLSNLLTLDMGGTSTDVCLVTDGEASMTSEYKIGGLPLSIPMFDIVTVGAGGGSIASIDAGGALRVGPESAGAHPGPACYDQGGERFTVTDANLVLGYLQPSTFFGGQMELSREAAQRALAPLADALKLDTMQVASGVIRLANTTMAQAMRLVSVERGHDPRDYTIVAFGGAGPLHAAALAEELSVKRVLVPYDPGLLSAYGLMFADTRQDYLRTKVVSLRDADQTIVASSFDQMREQAKREFERYQIAWDEVQLRHLLDMRFEGQAYELDVDVSDVAENANAEVLAKMFRQAHLQRYGHVPDGDSIEIVNFRLIAWHPSTVEPTRNFVDGPSGRATSAREGNVIFDGVETSCRFIDRSNLPPGQVVAGLAVIEEPTATTLLPPGWSARVDDNLSLILSQEGE